MKMERRIGVVLLLHVVALTAAVNETIFTAGSNLTSTTEHMAVETSSTTALNKTDLNSTETSPVVLAEAGTPLANVTLDMLNQPVQGDGTKKNSVPRKGLSKDSVKPRKGVDQTKEEPQKETVKEPQVINTTTNPTFKFKPLASETQSTEDEVSVQPDYTALIVGLSLGIALVLILASVTYWRLRDVWERRQYKRVDFLIDGLYTDT